MPMMEDKNEWKDVYKGLPLEMLRVVCTVHCVLSLHKLWYISDGSNSHALTICLTTDVLCCLLALVGIAIRSSHFIQPVTVLILVVAVFCCILTFIHFILLLVAISRYQEASDLADTIGIDDWIQLKYELGTNNCFKNKTWIASICRLFLFIFLACVHSCAVNICCQFLLDVQEMKKKMKENLPQIHSRAPGSIQKCDIGWTTLQTNTVVEEKRDEDPMTKTNEGTPDSCYLSADDSNA